MLIMGQADFGDVSDIYYTTSVSHNMWRNELLAGGQRSLRDFLFNPETVSPYRGLWGSLFGFSSDHRVPLGSTEGILAPTHCHGAKLAARAPTI